MNNDVIIKLKTLARTDCFYDNEDEYQIIYELCGGNVDDAFQHGVEAGEILLAREVLTNMGIDWD